LGIVHIGTLIPYEKHIVNVVYDKRRHQVTDRGRKLSYFTLKIVKFGRETAQEIQSP
jgi:hypothetical protein